MMHQRYQSHSRNRKDDNMKNDGNYHDDKKDDKQNKIKEKPVIAGTEAVHVNEMKLASLLYFPLFGIVLTSCLGDMYHRNSTLHREPNTARQLLVDCPLHDPDHVWILLVCCYLVVVVSIGVLCCTMLGLSFSSVGTERSIRMRVIICRICLILIYCGYYNWDMCMGTMPYLKKSTTQVYFACIMLFLSSPTLSMPIILQTSKSSPSKPPCWPIFLTKMMLFIPYADAGWHKLYLGFSGTSLRAMLVHHWVYYERPIGLLLIGHPAIISASVIATLIFECAGWILLIFDYDRLAAVIALQFHIGIYLAMYVDFLSFWGISYVFFFVPTIISSSLFQRLLKRMSGDKSVLVPLGGPLLVGIEGDNKDIHSTINDIAMHGESNSESKRKRRSSVLMAVSFALVLTYKCFYPYSFMLPDMPQSLSPSFLAIIYMQLSGMTFKPFNSYTMYASAEFPMGCRIAYLNLKRSTSQLTATELEHIAPNRRVKWIPQRNSDFYLYSNILNQGIGGMGNTDKTFTLNSLNNNTMPQRTVTQCNVFACLAQQYILSESPGDGTKDESRGTRREVAIDSSWDVDSIELVEEWYDESTAVLEGAETSGIGSLQKKIVPYCAIRIGGDSPQQKPRDSLDFDWYEDGSCGDILAELDASARSFKASSGKNPFYIESGVSRTQKYKTISGDVAVEVGLGTVAMVMLVIGYKTYLLAR